MCLISVPLQHTYASPGTSTHERADVQTRYHAKKKAASPKFVRKKQKIYVPPTHPVFNRNTRWVANTFISRKKNLHKVRYENHYTLMNKPLRDWRLKALGSVFRLPSVNYHTQRSHKLTSNIRNRRQHSQVKRYAGEEKTSSSRSRRKKEATKSTRRPHATTNQLTAVYYITKTLPPPYKIRGGTFVVQNWLESSSFAECFCPFLFVTH